MPRYDDYAAALLLRLKLKRHLEPRLVVDQRASNPGHLTRLDSCWLLHLQIFAKALSLTSTLHWFETELLTQEEQSRRVEGREPGGARAGRDGHARRIVLDMDSSKPGARGAGRERNGHFESAATTRCFCSLADLYGNVHSAEDWDDLLLRIAHGTMPFSEQDLEHPSAGTAEPPYHPRLRCPYRPA